MKTTDPKHIKELIDRLGRINAADEWGQDINPTQWTALSYLAKANRFSRAPSQVSDFLAATRGTVSQTLKALAKKGLVEETRSKQDKRSISYSVTDAGRVLFQKNSTIEDALLRMDEHEATILIDGLENLVRNALKQRGMKAFGVCKTCDYHRKEANGGFCKLLDVSLSFEETKQICHEHSQAG